MNELQTNSFNYSLLDTRTAEFLKRKEKNMREIVGQAYTELGRELYEAHQKLASHNKYKGVFVKWCAHIGFSMKQVYRLIDRYKLLTNCQNNEQKQLLEDLPISLTYEIAKQSANEELKQKVFNGEIKTHKEYKEMERKLKEAEQKYKQLERELQVERNKKKEVIEKEVIKEVIPHDVKEELVMTKNRLQLVQKELRKLEKEKEVYEFHKDDFNEEEAERQRKKLEWEAEKSVLEMKIQVDKFLKEVAVTAFRKGAIAASSKATKEKLKQSVDELREFINEMDIALSGRIKIN